MIGGGGQEWAKNTGRWKEGDAEPNYAQLKTRLRCAFNKAPDIDEIKELHCTKSDEPYKVYRFTERRGTTYTRCRLRGVDTCVCIIMPSQKLAASLDIESRDTQCFSLCQKITKFLLHMRDLGPHLIHG